MNLRLLARGAFVFLVAGAISGCALGAQTGSVVVEVRAMTPGSQGNSYDVTVRGPDQKAVESLEVSVGQSITIDDVPLGWVSIEADSLCTVESELTKEHPTMRLIADAANCTLAD